jgi:hypothetical protein
MSKPEDLLSEESKVESTLLWQGSAAETDLAERKRLYEVACFKEEQYYERERMKAEKPPPGLKRKRMVSTKSKLQRQIEKQRLPNKAYKPVSW